MTPRDLQCLQHSCLTRPASGLGEQHQWKYVSDEGRTTSRAAVAQDAGIEGEIAGPAAIRDTVRLMGRIAIDDSRHARIQARFPGTVRAVRVQQGDRVQDRKSTRLNSSH